VKKKPVPKTKPLKDYNAVQSGVLELLDAARQTSARTVNSIMTATYWEVGRRIVEFEQGARRDWCRICRHGFGKVFISPNRETRFARRCRANCRTKHNRQSCSNQAIFRFIRQRRKILQTVSAKSSPLSALADAFTHAPNLACAFSYLRYTPFQRMPCGGISEIQPDGDK